MLLAANNNIYTVNEKYPRAEVIAVQGNMFVFVGSSNSTQKRGKKWP